jgi:O-antigen ligase
MLWLLLATVLAVPLLFSPRLDLWRWVKPFALQLSVLALMGLALLQSSAPASRARVAAFFQIGPNQPILILLLYGAVSWFRSPSGAFSAAEWLRLAGGVGLYYVVVATLQERRQLLSLVGVLVVAAALTSLYGLATFGQRAETSMSSSFGNGQLFSGFLLLLLPLLVALAFSAAEGRLRLMAQFAIALAVPALLLAQTRSSWIGMAAALLVLGALALRFTPAARRGALPKHQIVVPLAALVGALGLFLVVSRMTPVIAARAKSLATASQDASFAWRLQMWRGAWQLIRERPLLGWGIGSFPLEQTRTVPFAQSRALVQRMGPSLHEQAHNEYLQIGTELGLLGLALYFWVLGAFFHAGLRALRRREEGFWKLVLLGCLAGVAGQMVDALSNPAWRFAEVSFLFWLMLGLGMAAARTSRTSMVEAAATGAPRRLSWQGAALGLVILIGGGAWAALNSSIVDKDGCPLPAYRDKLRFTLYYRTTSHPLAFLGQFNGVPDAPSNKTPPIVGPLVVLKAGECVTFRITADCPDDPSLCTGETDVSHCFKSFVEPNSGACFTNQQQGNSLGAFCAGCGSRGCQNTVLNDQIWFAYKDSGRSQSVVGASVRVDCSPTTTASPPRGPW